MYLGWNLQDKMLFAANSEEFEKRMPIVQAFVKLGYFQGKNFPVFYAEIHRLCPCDTATLQISKENEDLMEKMKSEILRTLVETIGTSYYFIDSKDPNSIIRFIDFGDAEGAYSGTRFITIPTTEKLDLNRK